MTALFGSRVQAGDELLDEPLRRLRERCREVAPDLRELGMALDRDPDAIVDHLDLPAFRLLDQVFTPPEFQTRPGAEPFDPTCTAMVVLLEAISHGDPNAILAAPGPSLSRDVVRELGDDTQRADYFGRIADGPKWTFFGLTEPGKGSAALELETRLTPSPDGDGFLLNGAKRYIGNGARAQVGVVFCRRAPGPWGIEAVVVDPADRVLGRHRPPSRRGVYGALHALLRFRPGLAAMTLGQTRAVCDYLRAHRPLLSTWDKSRVDGLEDRVAAVLRATLEVARDVDHGVVNQHRIGAVKMRAAQLGERATILAAELLGPASLIEHPWLEKAYRDLRAFEFMEGTSNLHRLSVFQGLLKNDFFREGEADASRD